MFWPFLFACPTQWVLRIFKTKDFQIDDITNIIPILMVAKCKNNSKIQYWDNFYNMFNLKIIFHVFGIYRIHGVSDKYFLFENNLVEFSGFPYRILFFIRNIFFKIPRIFFIRKINNITNYFLFGKWFKLSSLN